jgi:aminodeoxyfutalosine deaminase
MLPAMGYPKIELHVHLEATFRPEVLFQIARRNGVALPVATVEELREFCRYRDFSHFIEVWYATTGALIADADFREVVVDYAARAAAEGAVYLEGIFSPIDAVNRGADWDAVFSGVCDGVQQAREEHGVELRLTPDITRGLPVEDACEMARRAIGYRERGIVAIGLGGPEAEFPPEPYAPAFDIARDGGLGSVPHAGETAGPASVRGALDALHADRIRHGVRAVEDPELLRELAEREVTCDVCILSNVQLGVVPSVAEHPLPQMLAAGVPCTVSTDDPTLFDCDLPAEHAAARQLGADPRALYDAGVHGALCDEATKERLRAIAAEHVWGIPAGG